jgi:hypothetical protein
VNRLLIPLGIGLLSLCLIVLTAACGQGKARVRVMNASPDESNLDFLIDSKAVASSVTYGAAGSYLSVNQGSRHFQVEASGSTTSLIDQTISLSSSADYTFLAANYSSSITGVVFTDDNTAPSSGNLKLRIVNASPSLATADVYIVAPGTNISGVNPTISSLAFKAASSYQPLSAGNYEVLLTAPGQKSAYIDTGSLAFSASQIRTFVALNSRAGGFTYSVLSDLN